MYNYYKDTTTPSECTCWHFEGKTIINDQHMSKRTLCVCVFVCRSSLNIYIDKLNMLARFKGIVKCKKILALSHGIFTNFYTQSTINFVMHAIMFRNSSALDTDS